jgi:hypothetical protein
MTWTESTEVAPAGEAVAPAERSAFTRRLLLIGAVPLAVNVGMQIAISRAEGDEAVWQNVLAVVVASLLFAAIAFALAQWAMRGSATRQVRTVVGLAVFTVLLVPVAWWSSAPALVGLQTWLLGQATGVARRPGGSTPARVASVLAAATAVGLVAFVLVVGTAEIL